MDEIRTVLATAKVHMLRAALTLMAACTLMTGTAAVAEVYRTVDENGNIIFTDTKPRDGKAETIEVSPVLIVPSTPVPSSTVKKKEQYVGYSSIDIITPSDEETFHNPQSITVSVTTIPIVGGDHRFRLLSNGKNIQESDIPQLTINQPDRGTHSLQVQIIDGQGKVLQTSPARTIYVRRPSALFRKPPPTGDVTIQPVS